MSDLIDRHAAIDALWKALYEYEDKTEKQFVESDDLNVEDWILHRVFVQNMSDIDRQTILELPSAQPEVVRCKDCKHKHLENMVWTCPFGLPGGENFFCGYGAEPYKGEQ